MLQENKIFDGQYKLLKLLGRGGFSEVWLAEEEFTHLQVALKIYAPGSGMDDDGIRTIGNEFKLLFTLNQPNLLLPRGFRAFENMPYLVLPYCAKGSALNLIGRMDEEMAWQFIAQVSSGLAYLHERDIIHQDIKPDNILIDDSGTFLITDFGISTKARSTLRKSVMMGNNAGGTTAYMGPERFSREPAPVKASDIWSLGATVFEMMTGELPFGELGGGLQKSGAEIPFIKGDYSDKLKNVVEQMLAPETWDRPLSATLAEWGTDRRKVKTKQIQAATPQMPERTGHATEMMPIVPAEPIPHKTPHVTLPASELQPHHTPHVKPHTPTEQNVVPENKRTSKVFWCVIGLFFLILFILFIEGLVQLNNYNKALREFESYLNKGDITSLNNAKNVLNDIKTMENGPNSYMITPRYDELKRKLDEKREGKNQQTESNGVSIGIINSKIELSSYEVMDSGGKGGHVDITVTTDAENYTATSDQSWCKITNQNDTSFRIVIEANTTDSTREAIVTVTAGPQPKSVVVTQKPKPNDISATNSNNTNTTSNSSATQNKPKAQAQTNSSTITSTTSTRSSINDKVYLAGYGYIEMIYVEGGTFTMGATDEQGADACDDEKPTHNVTLNSYYIGKYEVSQGLWCAIMEDTPSQGDNYPVDNVSWNDCMDFIKKLNQKTGKNFRLPTEAEWEYAARGGKNSKHYKYSGGNAINDVAWNIENSGYWRSSHQIGTKLTNELGIYDMSGNVCEWCSDWFGLYTRNAQTNPTGPSNGSQCVVRGGSYSSYEWNCRVSYRRYYSRSDNTPYIGFRLAMNE